MDEPRECAANIAAHPRPLASRQRPSGCLLRRSTVPSRSPGMSGVPASHVTTLCRTPRRLRRRAQRSATRLSPCRSGTSRSSGFVAGGAAEPTAGDPVFQCCRLSNRIEATPTVVLHPVARFGCAPCCWTSATGPSRRLQRPASRRSLRTSSSFVRPGGVPVGERIEDVPRRLYANPPRLVACSIPVEGRHNGSSLCLGSPCARSLYALLERRVGRLAVQAGTPGCPG